MKMSSSKTSKTSKSTSKEDKDIVVSFASDSDDDERSSTASSDPSDSDGIKQGKAAASPATAAATTSIKQKATKQVEPGLNDEAADQQPSRKQVTPPSDEEKPASKTTKSKSKELSKSASQENENGSTMASTTDKTNKADEPKVVKKKKTVKADSTAVNGDSKQEDASEDVKRGLTENSETTEVGDKKKSTKTTKKTSKSVEKIENVEVNSTTADKKSKPSDEVTAVVVTPPATIAAETDDSIAKPQKKTKKSSKTSSATVNGECDKTVPAEAPNEKVSEKKLLKKSKETVEDVNSTTVDILATVDKQDAVKQETNVKPTADNIPKQSDEGTSSGQSASKVKLKKKKEKTGDAKLENEQPIEPEATIVTNDEAATSGKVVKKKKVKKVASSDNPTDSADSFVPTITIEATDTIEKLDLDADREVQLICDNQLEVAATNSENFENTIQEVTAIATESKPTELTPAPAFGAISEDKEVELQKNVSPSDTVKLSVSSGGQADNSGSYITTLEERTHDYDVASSSPLVGETPISTSKEDNKEYLTVSENKLSSADVNKEDSKSRENEESDYTYRRKSMDDFIKRILAEAREEQQKKLNAMPSSNGDNSSSAVPAAETNNEPQKSNDGLEFLSVAGIDKDDTLLDKGLISADRKKIPTGYPSLDIEDKKSTVYTDVDLDDDLAQIKGYFSRRGQTSLSKLDSLNDITSSTERNRLALGDSDDLSITHKILKDVLPDDSGTFSSRFRQTERNDAAADDDFVPKRREETSEIVRSSIKPVRSVIDQQTEVIQQLKTTSRSIDDLESEIRALRETFLDRQARIDSLRSAIDAESRMYEAEQTAANDRIQQQKIPGGRFVRDEFLASFTPRLGLMPGGETSLRSRSGSISSISGVAIGSLSIGSGINEPVSVPRATSLKPVSGSADTQRLQLGDADDSLSTTSGYSPGRFRRGGSVARERTYTMEEMLGGTGGYGASSSTLRTSGLPPTDVLAPSTFSSSSWSSYSTSASPDVSRQYQPGLSYSSSYTRRFQNDNNDYRSPSSYGSTSAYSDGGRTSSQYLNTRSYVRDSTSPSPSVSSSYSLTSSGSIDPSRFRRAQSVIDVSSNYDSSPSYVSTAGSTSGGGGEFHSRFLDKVRGKKSSEDSGSGQFKSRFLRSNFDSSLKKY
jgi:hypothetical protein